MWTSPLPSRASSSLEGWRLAALRALRLDLRCVDAIRSKNDHRDMQDTTSVTIFAQYNYSEKRNEDDKWEDFLAKTMVYLGVYSKRVGELTTGSTWKSRRELFGLSGLPALSMFSLP